MKVVSILQLHVTEVFKHPALLPVVYSWYKNDVLVPELPCCYVDYPVTVDGDVALLYIEEVTQTLRVVVCSCSHPNFEVNPNQVFKIEESIICQGTDITLTANV